MHVSLVTPTEQRNLDAVWVECDTPVGNFVIEEQHAPMLLTLVQGRSLIIGFAHGLQESFLIYGDAIVHITRKKITVFLERLET